jgi:hypothetical protein
MCNGPKSFNFVLLAAFVVGFTGHVSGQEKSVGRTQSVPSSGVVVLFQGDTVGVNIANVLGKIYDQPGSPTEQYLPKEKETICTILDNRLYPGPCELYYSLIDHINDAPVSKGTLQSSNPVILPGITLTKEESIRVFSKDDKDQNNQANELLRNWRELGAMRIEPKRPSDSYAIKFTSYKLLVPTSDDRTAYALFESLRSLRSRNIIINPLLKDASVPAKFNSSSDFPSADKIRELCLSDSLKDRNVQYLQLLDGDINALAQMKAGLGRAKNVTVYLIDTVLHNPPSIRGKLEASASGPADPTWRCKWADFNAVQHHATHLAGLIAGSGKPFAFEGISDNAKLGSFEWWNPDPSHPSRDIKPSSDRDTDLADLFKSAYQDSETLPVYLAATEFEPYQGLVEGLLEAEDSRWKGREPEQSIVNARPLLIAAAGQASENEPIAMISTRSRHSPQNLGNLENVIVVTSCGDCGRASVRLYNRAYYSSAGQRMVHVAAPGVEPVAGWIDDDSVGAAGGTSQAAALVAGVASSMIGHFPTIYTEPRSVKIRLQITSRPLPPLSDGTPNPDAQKLSAGIVDPILALMDPSKHWIKQNGEWKAIKIAKWSSVNVNIVNTLGSVVAFKPNAFLRMVKTRELSDQASALWTVYLDAFKFESSTPGEVRREDFIRRFGNTSIILCDNTAIKLDKIDDLILSKYGVGSHECSSN